MKSRKSLYKLLKSIGAPRFSANNADPKTAPSATTGQAFSLVKDVHWIRWTLTTEDYTLNDGPTATVHPTVDQNLPELTAETGQHYSKWMNIPLGLAFGIGAFLTGSGVGIAILVILVLALLSGIIQAFSTASGLTILGLIACAVTGSILMDARRSRFIKTVQGVESWLKNADSIRAPIPREWLGALDDAMIHRRVIDWVLSRCEIDDVEGHIREGVKLRKHLSPTDPRRRTMQTEIDTQRSKRDQLETLRRENADHISETVHCYLADKRHAHNEEQKRTREAAMERREKAAYKRRVKEVGDLEQARVRKHEQIDKWLDGAK